MSRFRVLLICSLLAGVFGGEAAGRNALHAVVSRGTTAVAAGDSGRILYSPQAPHVNWIPADPDPTRTPLRSVTIGSNDYLVVGDDGRMMRSFTTVGDKWRPLSPETDADLLGASRTENRFLAVGTGGAILRSATVFGDGWEAIESPTLHDLRSVVGGTAYSVAVGDSGTILWAVTSNVAIWYEVESVPSSEDLLGVTVGPGASQRFWAVGRNGVILRSLPNPQQWDLLDSPAQTDLNSVTFYGEYGVAVGDGGTILFSNGGATWTSVESPTTQDLYGVAYTGSGLGGRFVAVGDENTILFSTLGNQGWTSGVVASKRTSWGVLRGSWGSRGGGK